MSGSGNGNGTLTKWMMGALFTIVLGISSVVYAGVVSRISILEADLKRVNDEKSEVLVSIGVLQAEMRDIKKGIDDLDEKVSSIIATTDNNTARYRDIIRQYEQLLKELRSRSQ